MSLNTEVLTNPLVRAAIIALGKGDLKSWLDLFTKEAKLYDDGRQTNFNHFSNNALGHERFTTIDKVENNRLDIFGHFHSDRWGDFKTYFKFHINTEEKIYRLDIGQVDY